MWASRSPRTKRAVPSPVLFCIPLTYSQERRPALLSAAAHAALWESGPWRGPAHSRAVMDVKRHPPDPVTLSHGCLSFALALPLENKPVGFFLVLGLQMSVKQRCGQKTNFESRGGFPDPELQRKAGKSAPISGGVTVGVLEKERGMEASRTWEGPASAVGGSAGWQSCLCYFWLHLARKGCSSLFNTFVCSSLPAPPHSAQLPEFSHLFPNGLHVMIL